MPGNVQKQVRAEGRAGCNGEVAARLQNISNDTSYTSIDTPLKWHALVMKGRAANAGSFNYNDNVMISSRFSSTVHLLH
jgi:hypothetical protein